MKAILYGAIAALVISVVAGVGLSLVPSDAASTYASSNVRR